MPLGDWFIFCTLAKCFHDTFLFDKQTDDYVDLYGYGKAFATSSWYHEDYVGKWDPKQAFLITGDGNDRYWCSEVTDDQIRNGEPTAIWFQFEQPKRVIKIRFEESKYKLIYSGGYEVKDNSLLENAIIII